MSEQILTPREAAERLKAFDRVLVLTHKRPDGDTVGCASALVQAFSAGSAGPFFFAGFPSAVPLP